MNFPDTSAKIPPPQERHIHAATLGYDAVMNDELAVRDRLTAGQIAVDMEVLQQQPDEPTQVVREPGVTKRFVSSERSAMLQEMENDIDTLHGFEEDYGNEAKESLAEVRKKLSKLTSAQRMQLDDYMNEAAPLFLMDVKERGLKNAESSEPDEVVILPEVTADERPSDIRQELDDAELPERDWADWMSEVATDEQLLNILQWHVRTLEQQQTHPEIQQQITAAKEFYKQRVQHAIEQGWLSDVAAENIPQLDDVKVYVGDLFDTFLQGMGGYHMVGSHELVIAQGSGLTEEDRRSGLRLNLQHALMHEFGHFLFNRERQATNLLGERWIDEALTEEVSLALRAPEGADAIPPAKSFVGTYQEERDLLRTLLRAGSRKVPMDLATRAYSGDEDDRRIFYDALNIALGPDALGAVNCAYDVYEQDAADKKIKGRAAQIYAVDNVIADLSQRPEYLFATFGVQQEPELVGATSARSYDEW